MGKKFSLAIRSLYSVLESVTIARGTRGHASSSFDYKNHIKKAEDGRGGSRKNIWVAWPPGPYPEMWSGPNVEPPLEDGQKNSRWIL